MSLSNLIVQREIASIREVEEALARQVLYGGDLLTNLLEVCRVDESALLPLVAESYGLPPAPAGELPEASAEAKRMVAAETASRRNLVPLSLERETVVVAVAEPLAPEVEQELGFAFAKTIAQRIAPLVRIKQALARDYGVPLERRQERLLARLRGERDGLSSYPPLHGATSLEVKAPPKPPSAIPPPPAPALPSDPVRPVHSKGGTSRTLVREMVPPPARATSRRGPVTADVARTELEEATDKDAILDVLFEFTRQYFDFSAIFVVKGETVEGRDSFGAGSPRETVARMAVPLDMPSLIASAYKEKTTAARVPARDGIDAVLMADLGRRGKTECVVIPIIVRNRVVALLFNDSGEGGVDPAGLAEVMKMVGQAGNAFERIIMKKKLPARPAGSPASPDTSSKQPSKIEVQPAVEELAPPVRDLMNEALTAAKAEELPSGSMPGSTSLSSPPRMPADQPPPANLLAVRRPTGRPIPREEPESTKVATPPGKRTRSSQIRRAEAPPLEFGKSPPSQTIFGGSAEPFGRVPSAPPTKPMGSLPTDDATPAPPSRRSSPSPLATIKRVGTETAQGLPLFPATDMASAAATSSAQEPLPGPRPSTSVRPQPPPSEQQVSVAPHRPPSARVERTSVLPSVIVDVSSEYVGLVERVVANADEDAEAEILRGGANAMGAIMARFPGPLTIEPERLTHGQLPRAAECGPIIRLVAAQRRTALPFVLAHVGDQDVHRRFWATFLLSELVYPDALESLLQRLFDEDVQVQRAARAAARAFADAGIGSIVQRLESFASDASSPFEHRKQAIDALGEARDPSAVPVLVFLMQSGGDVGEAAKTALTVMARQDFGTDVKKWEAWWDANKDRHRLEWLIDSLMHDQAAIRAQAGEELKMITNEFFGYYEDLPKRERERAQKRYRDWWNSVGKVRFARPQRAD